MRGHLSIQLHFPLDCSSLILILYRKFRNVNFFSLSWNCSKSSFLIFLIFFRGHLIKNGMIDIKIWCQEHVLKEIKNGKFLKELIGNCSAKSCGFKLHFILRTRHMVVQINFLVSCQALM